MEQALRFTLWEEGQALLMVRNEHHFEKDSAGKSLPILDGIKILSFSTAKPRSFEFRQGRPDFINDIDASFKDEVLTKKGDLRKE